MSIASDVARRYCQAVLAGSEALLGELWCPGAKCRVLGLAPCPGADLAELVASIRRAAPDLEIEPIELLHDDGVDRAAVVWRLTGTFTGAPFRGVAPTGARIELECCDVLRIEEERITRGNVYFDNALLADQVGGLPELIAEPPQEIADGVWIVRGGYPLRSMNVYLIRDGAQVAVFDTGSRAMAGAVRAAVAELGGASRVILGHGHSDHRANAASIDAPVYCHPAERADAEGDGGMRYMDTTKLAVPATWVMPTLMRAYDGPPPAIAGTLEDGDEVAGFRVIHLPGHAPGLIGLWRERDRLALVSDCFYLTDMDQIGRPGPARVPHPATTCDLVMAAQSIRTLAQLDPAQAWPGHMGPLTGDVARQLTQAAEGWRVAAG